MKSNEWQKICVHKTFKIEIQKRGPNNSDLLQHWFPLEIRSPLFNFQKFEDSKKSTPEPCTMHWNLMNADEFGARKLFKLNYRRGDQIIETFAKLVPLRNQVPRIYLLQISRLWEEYSSIMQNTLRYNEWQWIWV